MQRFLVYHVRVRVCNVRLGAISTGTGDTHTRSIWEHSSSHVARIRFDLSISADFRKASFRRHVVFNLYVIGDLQLGGSSQLINYIRHQKGHTIGAGMKHNRCLHEKYAQENQSSPPHDFCFSGSYVVREVHSTGERAEQ